MEITMENFESEFPLIRESIEQSDYFSIDLEFSGYTAHKDDRGHDYDTNESRYQKLRSVVSKFIGF